MIYHSPRPPARPEIVFSVRWPGSPLGFPGWVTVVFGIFFYLCVSVRVGNWSPLGPSRRGHGQARPGPWRCDSSSAQALGVRHFRSLAEVGRLLGNGGRPFNPWGASGSEERRRRRAPPVGSSPGPGLASPSSREVVGLSAVGRRRRSWPVLMALLNPESRNGSDTYVDLAQHLSKILSNASLQENLTLHLNF